MSKLPRLTILATALLASCTATGALDPDVRAGARVAAFLPIVNGSAFTGAGGSAGNMTFGEVGQDESDFNGYYELMVGYETLDLTVDGFSYRRVGQGNYMGNYMGTGFAGPVQSDFEIQNWRAYLGWDPVDQEELSAGIVGGVMVQDMHFRLYEIGGSAAADFDEELPVPFIGIRGEARPIKDLGLGVLITGSRISIDGFDNELLDAQGGIFWRPADHFEVFLGYRSQSYDFDGVSSGIPVDMSVDIDGFMLGIGGYF